MASLAIGCSDSSGDETGGGPPGTETTGVGDERTFDEAVAQARGSGIGERTRAVIKSQGEWATAWAAMNEGHEPKPPVPYVDFSRHVVLLAAMGARPSGGFSIKIENVTVNGRAVSAEVHESSPGNNCLTTQAVTHPTAVTLAPRTEGEVTFVESASVDDGCDG